MMNVRAWRWPLVVGLPLIIGSVLVWRGILRLNYEGRAVLSFSGSQEDMNADVSLFRSHAVVGVSYERIPGQPLQLLLRAQGSRPSELVDRLVSTGQAFIGTSLTKQKAVLVKEVGALQVRKVDLESQFNQLLENRKTLVAGTKHHTPRAEILAKVEDLKARRRQLIERYPTHSDIPVLAKQIQTLLSQLSRPAAPVARKATDMDREINETKLRLDYFTRQFQQASQVAQLLKPQWKIVRPVEKPSRPNRVVGWPIAAGVLVLDIIFGIVLMMMGGAARENTNANGLWKPEASKVPETPVALEVVSPEPASETAVAPMPQAEVPMDPLTDKASLLYAKWVDVAKALYEPAPEPPQGILDQVAPLLQESSDFIAEGHEVLTKYLARCVTSGDLAAHVARTVLMTLTGAQEAGVSPEHRLAMALAALFHDLAVVPRPAGLQEDVGSEVGRLSATVLRRIPGLPVALLSMVEDILIGMDEFKLETWQNTANGKTLEPLSKVLREIDRFEKVMQKQKSRLDRRVANQ